VFCSGIDGDAGASKQKFHCIPYCRIALDSAVHQGPLFFCFVCQGKGEGEGETLQRPVCAHVFPDRHSCWNYSERDAFPFLYSADCAPSTSSRYSHDDNEALLPAGAITQTGPELFFDNCWPRCWQQGLIVSNGARDAAKKGEASGYY